MFLSYEFSYEFNYIHTDIVIPKENEFSKASNAERGPSTFYREIFGENRGRKGGGIHGGIQCNFEKYWGQSKNSRYIKWQNLVTDRHRWNWRRGISNPRVHNGSRDQTVSPTSVQRSAEIRVQFTPQRRTQRLPRKFRGQQSAAQQQRFER